MNYGLILMIVKYINEKTRFHHPMERREEEPGIAEQR